MTAPIRDFLRALAGKREHLLLREKILLTIRSFFREAGFMEVTTPVRSVELIPEEHIDPLRSEGSFLLTSPELHMKQLLAAGYERIFTIGPCFRRGERGRLHHPEFQMLEWYRAGGDLASLKQDVEDLFLFVLDALERPARLESMGLETSFEHGWEHWRVRDIFLERAGWDPVTSWDPDRFDRDMVDRVEPGLGAPRPAFLSHYPAPAAALARLSPEEPGVAERVEAYVAGLELANGFVELTDPSIQRERFEQANRLRKQEGRQPVPVPERFLAALAHMPPAAGIAFGLDRLVLLLSGAESLDEITAFPPEEEA